MIKGILINKILGLIGFKLCRTFDSHIKGVENEFIEIYKKCKPFTVTSLERMYSLYKAVEYAVKNQISGDFVECGVWRGGSSILMAMTLIKLGETKKAIYLYDTYAGMSEPTQRDIDFMGKSAINEWRKNQRDNFNNWTYAHLEEVKHNLFLTGYPKEKLIFVKGKVENTIPKEIPRQISILRLDTDWYESTYHELRYLFPRLSLNGVIIIDDYDFFRGQREAIDQYFKENNIHILLNIIDGAARIGIKTST